jgi:excisionase family DNA binding protein
VDSENTPDFLPSTEAARLLGLSKRLIDRWVDAGRIPIAFVAPDGECRIRRADLEAMVAKWRRANDATS